ncbi:hypothetical protein HanHA300_Chr03g0076951 [Helianthus annuus]|nr:hypothetical protein HanHA300_Chr03g0076951 [Helianthus annuus]KAJ0766754.1 hypothetical protein HanLR1_Chr03g0081181 [Helianthus annuus]
MFVYRVVLSSCVHGQGDGACSFFARIESTFEFHSPATLSVSFQAEPRLDFSLPSWSPSSSQEAHVLKKKNELLFQVSQSANVALVDVIKDFKLEDE